MTIRIGNITYAFLRDAINSAVSGNEILIGTGTYNIASNPNYTPGFPNASVNSNYATYSLSRFYSSRNGITGLKLTGAGVAVSTISNLSRIYVTNKDRGFGLPTNWTISDLTLNFNLPYSGPRSGDYILQTGISGSVQGAATGLTLRNLAFTGNHAGSPGSNGAYCLLYKANNLLVDGIEVSLAGQQGYSKGSKSTVSSGGSAFLFVQGDSMNVQNSTFHEDEYSNALTIFNSASFGVINNHFYAGNQNKQRGEVISSSDGVVQNNQFSEGSYLDFLNPASKAVAIANNKFSGIADSAIVGIGVRIDGASSISAARNLDFSGNTFKNVVPFVSLINEAATGSTGASAQLVYGTNDVWNPSTNTSDTWDRFLVGGLSNDTLSGYVSPGASNLNDFIIGGPGSDVLSGDEGNDAFVFTAAPGTIVNNVDTIADFNAFGKGVDKIWLNSAVFTPLAKGALGADFGKYINYNSADSSIFYDKNGLGGVVENDSTVFKVAILGPGLSAVTSGDFVVF